MCCRHFREDWSREKLLQIIRVKLDSSLTLVNLAKMVSSCECCCSPHELTFCCQLSRPDDGADGYTERILVCDLFLLVFFLSLVYTTTFPNRSPCHLPHSETSLLTSPRPLRC